MLSSDLHIHTLMSGHAFSTVDECIKEAKNKGLSVIAIADHGPAMEHSAHEGYFEMSTRLPKHINGIQVLFGCEMNIINKSGDVDLSHKVMSGLDIVLAGLHARTPYIQAGEAENTAAIINAMVRNPSIQIISHPYRVDFPVSVCDVAQAAKEYNVILEINVYLLAKAIETNSDSASKVLIDKTSELVSCIHSIGGSYLINSDAHYSGEIGISHAQYQMLEAKLGIRQEYVLNDDFETLRGFIPAIS